jgi:hypothetical protein
MTTRIDTISLFPLSAEIAWRRYLDETRSLDPDDYERGEADAWDRLQGALGRVRPDPRDAA